MTRACGSTRRRCWAKLPWSQVRAGPDSFISPFGPSVVSIIECQLFVMKTKQLRSIFSHMNTYPASQRAMTTIYFIIQTSECCREFAKATNASIFFCFEFNDGLIPPCVVGPPHINKDDYMRLNWCHVSEVSIYLRTPSLEAVFEYATLL